MSCHTSKITFRKIATKYKDNWIIKYSLLINVVFNQTAKSEGKSNFFLTLPSQILQYQPEDLNDFVGLR